MSEENIEFQEENDEEVKAVLLDAHFKKDGDKRSGEEVRQLTVQANSVVEIDFRLRPLINYIQLGLACSIKGDRDKKPLVKAVVNNFIKHGKKRYEPDFDEDHYIDYNDTYRFSSRKECVKGAPGSIGYEFHTREPGEYYIRFKVATTSGGGIAGKDLLLIVQ